MFRKSFILLSLTAFASGVLLAQTPEPKKDGSKEPRIISWSFDGGDSYLGVQTQEVNKDNFGKLDRKSTRLNSSHIQKSRMPSSA